MLSDPVCFIFDSFAISLPSCPLCALQNLRAVYDKHGKKMMEKEGTEIKMEDAAGFFANIFGGDRFIDYVRCLSPSH